MLEAILVLAAAVADKGAIRRHERLGGVLAHYRREAA
jgi:hypothetical protein